MDKVHRPTIPKRADLIRVYDVCNKVFKGKDCFYTESQLEELKKDKTKIFI